MDFLRNLPTQQPQQLTQLIQIQPGRVVSMAMSRQEHCQMTLLAFGDGESISEECYFGDTLYSKEVEHDGENEATLEEACLSNLAFSLESLRNLI